MDPIETQGRCPKCGEPMYLLPYSCATNHGVRVCDAICKNCLHVEQVTFVTKKANGSWQQVSLDQAFDSNKNYVRG